MNTKTLSALALSLVVAASSIGVAAPALASDSKFDTDYYIAQLRYDGIDAIQVELVDGQVIKAVYIGPNGHTTYGFFDKDTLAPVKW